MPEIRHDLIDIVQYQPGELIFRENDSGSFFLIIQKGEVEVFRLSGDQQKIPLAIIGPGQSLGEFAAIDQKPRSASAQALTFVEATKISEPAYQQLLTELPEWASCVLSSLVERIRRTNDIIRSHAIVDSSLNLEIETIKSRKSTTSKTSNKEEEN